MKSSPDSGCSSSSSQIPTPSPQQRRGKWSAEEEIYALAAIHDFNAGCLDAPAGITLRGYLSDRLQCDPMRITKKFHGDASIGKKVFHPTEKDNPTTIAAIKGAQDKLEHLHQKWKQRIELQEREVARKSLVETSSINGGGVNSTIQGDITNRTAMWLEGADNLLSGRSSAKIEIEDEMKAISILIEQAPGILENLPKLRNNKHNQSCPKLPIICTSSGSSSRQVYTEQRDTVYTGRRKGSLGNETDSPNSAMKILASLSSQAAPVPIDTTNRGECVDNVNNSRSAIADAQTFVDFLQSVNR